MCSLSTTKQRKAAITKTFSEFKTINTGEKNMFYLKVADMVHSQIPTKNHPKIFKVILPSLTHCEIVLCSTLAALKWIAYVYIFPFFTLKQEL